MSRIKIFPDRETAFNAVEEGAARRVVIGEKKICLARWKDSLYAIQDRCPHSQASLSQGKVNNRGEMVCPLHSYCYELSTGREYQELTEDAETWPVEVSEEGVYIVFE